MGCGGSKEEVSPSLLETLEGHTDAINVIALSEDESLLVTGSEDNTARMWSTKTDQTECLGVLEGHTSYITCLAVTDVYILTGSADSTIRKWDMTTCECLFIFQGHCHKISRVICTGDFLLSTSADKTAKAWIFNAQDFDGDDLDKVCIRTFKGHTKAVIPIVYIPSESNFEDSVVGINPADLIITGSNDGTCRTYSFDTGANLKVLKSNRGPITSMATDPKGKMLYTGSYDGSVLCWNIQTGEKRKELVGHSGAILCLQVVNKLMYTASADGKARCWVREFGDCTKIYEGHRHSVTTLKFKEGILYTGCGDAVARAFEAKSGTLKREFIGPDRAITSLTIANNKLYTADAEGVLRSWDIKGLSEGIVHCHEDNVANENEEQQLAILDKRLDHYVPPPQEPDIPQRIKSPEVDPELEYLENELKL